LFSKSHWRTVNTTRFAQLIEVAPVILVELGETAQRKIMSNGTREQMILTDLNSLRVRMPGILLWNGLGKSQRQNEVNCLLN
jgi:hypothetical protein